MTTGDLLSVQPSELKFPFELKKQSTCSMQLTNKTDKHLAFKVKTTNPRKYCVRPNTGLVSPGSTCNVSVTMQGQKDMPQDMQCKDKFLVQSAVAPDGATTTKDVIPELFDKAEGKVIEEFRLRVVYIPANPPSPVPEEPEEESPLSASLSKNAKQTSSLLESVSRSLEISKQKSSEAWTMIAELTDQKTSALQENQKLLQELELARKEPHSKTSGVGEFSLMFLAIVFLLGFLIGHFVNRT